MVLNNVDYHYWATGPLLYVTPSNNAEKLRFIKSANIIY